MTSFSLKGVVLFLLSNGFSYVLTAKFCQDDLENYFGHQLSMGRRRDNPRVYDAGYNGNTILLNQLPVMFEGHQVNGMLSMKLH